MSLIKDLLSHKEDTTLLKLLRRQVQATERIADALESLLPSPLAPLEQGNLRPPVAEIKIYGEKEAYRDEIQQRRKDLEEM